MVGSKIELLRRVWYGWAQYYRETVNKGGPNNEEAWPEVIVGSKIKRSLVQWVQDLGSLAQESQEIIQINFQQPKIWYWVESPKQLYAGGNFKMSGYGRDSM